MNDEGGQPLHELTPAGKKWHADRELSLSRHYLKVEKFAVARRSDGKFLALDITPGTTTPSYVDNPIDAHRINPYADEPLREPPYYFENLPRMRIWLKDCAMVWIKLVSGAHILTDQEALPVKEPK